MAQIGNTLTASALSVKSGSTHEEPSISYGLYMAPFLAHPLVFLVFPFDDEIAFIIIE